MARLFNGSSQYLQVDNAPVAAYPFTIACWFRPDTVTNGGDLISLPNSGSQLEWWSLEARGDQAGDPIRARVSSGGTHQYAKTTTGFTANTWHHAIGLFTSSTDVKAYLDNGGEGTLNPGRTPSGVNRLSIGRIGDSTPSNYYDGRIAEVGIWDVALSASEREALAGGVSPSRVRPQNLVGGYHLFGNGSPEPDMSGNGNNLTLFSGPTLADHAPVQSPYGYGRYIVYEAVSGGALTLTADTGAFTLTGNSAILTRGRTIIAGTGSFTETGNAAGLIAARNLSAGTGSYTLTGNAAALVVDRILAAGTGSYILTGVDVILTKSGGNPILVADTGAFTLTGNTAGLTKGRVLVAGIGSFTEIGNDATLTRGRKLSAETGVFAETGNDAGLIAARKLAAETGALVLTGSAAGLIAGRVLTAGSGAYVLTGNVAGLARGLNLAAGTGVFVLTGVSVTLTRPGDQQFEELLITGLLVKTGNVDGLTILVGDLAGLQVKVSDVDDFTVT